MRKLLAEIPDTTTMVAATVRKPWLAPQVIVAAGPSGAAKSSTSPGRSEQHTTGSGVYSS
jgi:hypothetical protein